MKGLKKDGLVVNNKRQKANQASEKENSPYTLKENEWHWKVEPMTGLDSDCITVLILLFKDFNFLSHESHSIFEISKNSCKVIQ